MGHDSQCRPWRRKEDENDLKEEEWDMTLSVGLIEEVEEEDDLKEEDD